MLMILFLFLFFIVAHSIGIEASAFAFFQLCFAFALLCCYFVMHFNILEFSTFREKLLNKFSRIHWPVPPHTVSYFFMANCVNNIINS